MESTFKHVRITGIKRQFVCCMHAHHYDSHNIHNIINVKVLDYLHVITLKKSTTCSFDYSTNKLHQYETKYNQIFISCKHVHTHVRVYHNIYVYVAETFANFMV